MSDYLQTLKDFKRPGKVKIKENQEEILLEVSMSDIVLSQIMCEQPNDGKSDLHAEIIKWFLENPYPNDDQVHEFAESMGVDSHEFEKNIYSILSSFLSEGNSKGKDINPDPKELEMGIKVEMEHTTSAVISRKIAMDHLAEIKDYYTRLAKMEKEAGVEHH